MIKKIFTVAIATVTLATSCQSDYIDMPSDSLTAETKVMSRSAGFSFPDGWQYLETNDERWAALQIPEDMLSTMSTEDLVEACMTYPLALDCFAYNDVQHGIADIIARFNGFAELKNRSDAFDKVLDYYGRKLEEIEILSNSLGYKFKPLLLSFYEQFIISGYLYSIEELKNSEKFVNLYYKANEIHNSHEELQGHNLTKSLSAIKEILGIKINPRFFFSSTLKTIYTKNGLPVIAREHDCVGASIDEQNGIDYIAEHYPNAKIVSKGSCRYNCHAYAWYISEGGEMCWINCTENNIENVSKFWTDGTYKETHLDFAEKIYYPTTDHSAIAETPVTYISKWGDLPLVRHDSNYGPYSKGVVRYFTKDFSAPDINEAPYKTGKVYWDMNPDPTPINTYEDFSISNYYDPSKYRTEIFISGGKEPGEPLEDNSRAYIISKSDNRATIYFASRGIYYICFHVYSKYTSNCIAKYISDEVYVL
ncbi:MAG: hypothetical protein K2I94_01440 [Muribaculaceae bacterium]|nr:hypothetical protein [Muribaculaceae bacterium]